MKVKKPDRLADKIPLWDNQKALDKSAYLLASRKLADRKSAPVPPYWDGTALNRLQNTWRPTQILAVHHPPSKGKRAIQRRLVLLFFFLLFSSAHIGRRFESWLSAMTSSKFRAELAGRM
ncbi:hypothetical protein [Agrobacterium pusense]|uniref:hypothetical protein n=1 Tax=Agrobacterium pusense TaxID=648995 RepID=UPI001F290EC1|nr:hypothetical protein [Agrobacterium pusense]